MIQTEPLITVGIFSAPEIRFCLEGDYCHENEKIANGNIETVTAKNGQIFYNGAYYSEICFAPVKKERTFFSLFDVTIGVQFHWERSEKQSFKGELLFFPDGDRIWAINRIPVEDYLKSVIASEMNGAAPTEFLKAHAVISRNWLLAQLERRNNPTPPASQNKQAGGEDKIIIKWYNRDDHTLFDVCADDHCQRYQGITRHISPQVLAAIEDTRGTTLLYNGKICDTRFSKCCGGITEEYQNCWQEEHHPYMPSIVDARPKQPVSSNVNYEKFILSSPDAFCKAPSGETLRQVLNDYDCETSNFYRWKVTYTQKEITELLYTKTGIDFEAIKNITPLKRGKSGRIIELKIEGASRSVIFGKELEIRRILSTSHLYSSAFVVETDEKDESSIPGKFILHGAGWGHGVGLCQIGAAVMGHKGYSYREILQHYYPPAILEKIYE